MPICPKCGGARIDRFCARCGTIAAPPILARTPRRPRSGARPLFIAFVLAAIGVVAAFAASFHVARVGPQAILTVPPMPDSPADATDLLRTLNIAVNTAQARSHALVTELQSRDKALADRQTALIAQSKG